MNFKVLFLSFFLTLMIQLSEQKTNFRKFKDLSGPEKCWVIFHPFVAKKAIKISETARVETQNIIKEKLLKGNGNSGQVDAFRHAFWMANLTLEIGAVKAKRLGIAHEKGNYRDYKKHKNEDGVIPDEISSEMDLFNNDVGINIGELTTDFDLKGVVIKAVQDGKCKIIKKDRDENYVDCNNQLIREEDLKGKWENNKCLVWSNEL